MSQVDVALVILGHPGGREQDAVMHGFSAVSGDGVEKGFAWQMGGDLRARQERGAVIGLNTLRLALLACP